MRVMMLCVILVCMMVSIDAFSGSDDVIKERYQDSDILALKEKVDKLERKISRLENIIIQNNIEKRLIELEKKQMEKDMNERLDIQK